MTKNDLYQLKAIDWNFFKKMTGLTGRIHHYPGAFPQEIPSALIQSLSQRNDCIFDPYGGSGTTAAEAIRLGRKCVVVDINPVSILATYALSVLLILKIKKEKCLNTLLKNIYNDVLINFSTLDFEHNIGKDNFDGIVEEFIYPLPKNIFEQILIDDPNWECLSKWIEKDTLGKIKKLHSLALKRKSFVYKILYMTMISNVLFSSSSQTRSLGHIADNVFPKENEFIKKDVIRLCECWVKNIEKMFGRVECTPFDCGIRAHVLFQDWNAGIIQRNYINFCDVLITSPPYANAVDYLNSQKLSLYLFGYNDMQIKTLSLSEIGARKKRKSQSAMQTWSNELIEALKCQLQFMKSGAKIAYILPENKDGREIGYENIKKLLSDNNYKVIFEQERSIDQLRASQTWRSILKEIILLFEHKGDKK